MVSQNLQQTELKLQNQLADDVKPEYMFRFFYFLIQCTYEQGTAPAENS